MSISPGTCGSCRPGRAGEAPTWCPSTQGPGWPTPRCSSGWCRCGVVPAVSGGWCPASYRWTGNDLGPSPVSQSAAAAASKAAVKKPAATTAKPKDASTTPRQKLTTNCQPCLSADANECYNIGYNLNPNYFASTGTSGDLTGLPCIFVNAGLVGISGCGINAASGEKDGSAGASGTGSSGDESSTLPPGGGDPSNKAQQDAIVPRPIRWGVLRGCASRPFTASVAFTLDSGARLSLLPPEGETSNDAAGFA